MIIHVIANPHYGFQRDEMLYLALGQHPDWGYWTVPPMIGWIAYAVQFIFGDDLATVRMAPTLLCCGMLLLTGGIAQELGAGRYGQFLAGLAILVSPAYLRNGTLFQPVASDIFFWTLSTYVFLRYLNTEEDRWMYAFGGILGFGLLNKYMVAFLITAIVFALLLTAKRSMLLQKNTWIAFGLLLLIFFPNFWWQYQNHFPVVWHMNELSQTQLVNVNRISFMVDQLLMNLPSVLLWLGGLYWLFLGAKSGSYRIFGWVFLFVIALMLALRGKSYYTLGIYPLAMGAGGVFWENQLNRSWYRWFFPALMIALIVPIFPFGCPILEAPAMARYGKWITTRLGLDGPLRWEDGFVHDLPQDYADMLGWDEMAQKVAKAYHASENPDQCLIYCDNYGEASAVYYARKKLKLPEPYSFNETFLLWAPPHITSNAMVYVNDDLGDDVKNLFAKIDLVGEITSPYSREKGTKIWLCQAPREDFGALWSRRLKEERGY
jgi:hypothetical protein